jgi:hypothetical protein
VRHKKQNMRRSKCTTERNERKRKAIEGRKTQQIEEEQRNRQHKNPKETSCPSQ